MFDLPGVAGDLADSHHHVQHLRELDVRPDDAGALGALEQRLAGFEQPRATLFEQSRVRIEIVQQFGRERPLRGEIADQPLEPFIERLPRVGTVELRGGVADLLEFIDVESL